jgi:hypothetical protein
MVAAAGMSHCDFRLPVLDASTCALARFDDRCFATLVRFHQTNLSKKTAWLKPIDFLGGGCWNRTSDARLFRPSLYQLS